MDVCVVGGGYVGLTTAVCFAEMGNNVRIIDVDKEKIEKIKKGIAPIYEEGLQEMLEKNLGRIEASVEYDFDEEVIFICVGTPSTPEGKIDLKYVLSAAESIAEKMKDGSIVVVKSTVFPGTTEKIVKPLIAKHGKKFSIAMNPEFLREGKAIYDFMNPDRIVIGVEDERAEEVLKELYKPIKAPLLVVTPAEAEMIKYASNALLATKISFANEIGNLCKIIGIDVYKVMKGVGMDHRISPHFLDAGIGFGGSCFPKDLKALYHGSKEMNYEMELIKAVLNVNERQPLQIIKILEKHMEIEGKVIAVLGLAFKANTDDVRESRSIPIIKELKRKRAIIKAYDPMAMENMQKIFPDITYCKSIDEALENADACLILTDWKEFENIDFSKMKNKLVIEGRRILKNKEGIIYEGVCW
ncbi:MAG: UDP-glucose 6-dehydrogenase [Thermoplasmata archaeon]|nr:MAG: UDP-glucose 6-dehydrogenase [Thermoplasmata archaeon]HDN95518.1 UDP-glucose/GDP-mannose dehydrogenase family protein [Thermoplasmatales archaeon]